MSKAAVITTVLALLVGPSCFAVPPTPTYPLDSFYPASNPNGFINSAQAASAAPVQSVNNQVGAVQIATNALAGGPFTLAGLPICTGAALGKIAYVTDLGGGADNIVCRGSGWARIRLGQATKNVSCSSIVIGPLAQSNFVTLGCSSGFTPGSNVNFVGNPGDEFWLTTPSSLGGLVSALGVQFNGVQMAGLSLLAATTYHYQVGNDGTLVLMSKN